MEEKETPQAVPVHPGLTSDTPPIPPAPPAVTAEHVNGLHARIEELERKIASGFEWLVHEIRKALPTVKAVGDAAAKAIPGVGPVVRAVEDVAGAVGGAAGGRCCAHDAEHGPNGCTAAGCSCDVVAAPTP